VRGDIKSDSGKSECIQERCLWEDRKEWRRLCH
jgi:hypothetical protein